MDLLEQIALTFTPGLGAASIRKLVDLYPNENIYSLPPSELKAAFGNHTEVALNIIGKAGMARAERELRYCEQHHIRPLFFTESAFPARLNRPETTDCPVLLYALGEAELNPRRSLAVVGTRRATHQGCELTDKLVEQMQPYGAPIVSGLAYGIDSAAHKAALQHKLPTLAVLGHGLDRIYPPENRRLAAEIVGQGGTLLTEYPAGTAINPRYFPARNRIIAALADGVLVVEASEKGGALITAGIAAGYHREVFAIPGRLTDPYSKGTNSLIATNKAILVRTSGDIARQMGWPEPEQAAREVSQPKLFPSLSAEEQRIVGLIEQREVLTTDELAELTQLPVSQLAPLLFNLELEQVLDCLPGRRYCLKH
ncbi:MAG: DNA-processing protein DprA [Bacteroidales bacterium]|nr:DNA-processing protein DprA [Bacteroidales bacterium]